MRFSDLTPGDEFPTSSFTLDAATVAAYLAATEDDNDLYWRDGMLATVPPMAVAALAFRGIARDLALEPGSLHTGQEITFHRVVAVGERLTATARVASSSKRRGFTALIIDLAALDDGGTAALSGRMTLMVAGADDAATEGGITSPEHLPGRLAIDGRTPNELSPSSLAHYPPIAPAVLTPGYTLPVLTRTVSQERIDRYAEASGDFNPIHLDPEFAARTSFGGTVAHGMLSLAYISTIIARAFGLAWCAHGTLKVKFRGPAPSGTTISVHGAVERLEEGAHGVQYAMCTVRVENTAGEALISGEARVGFE